MNMHAQKSLSGYFTDQKTGYQSILSKVNEHVKNNNYEQALGLLDTIYFSNRHDIHLNLLLAEIHLSIQQFRESNRYYSIANKIDSNNSQALYGLGKTAYLRGDFDQAITYLRKTLKDEAFQGDVYNDLGTIYEEIGQLDEAESCLVRSIKLKPSFISPVINISSLLVRRDRHKEALVVIDQYLLNNPPDDRLLVNQGIIREELNRYEDAIDSFTKAIELNPNNIQAYFDRAYCYLKLSRIETARADLKTYLAIKPDAEQVKGLLALTYTLEGKFQDSMDTWKEFLPIFQKFKNRIPRTDLLQSIHPVNILQDINASENRSDDPTIGISIVIPVFNEEGSLIILYESLKQVLTRLGQNSEIIFIDDGSTDNSPYILTDISNKDSTVSVIKFRKNYGQTAAFAAGFKFSRGDVVITMDADLQNDPEDIPQLLEKMSEGYDLVSGWRRDRKDKTLSRKFPSFFANRIINKLIEGTQVKIHDFGCSLKAYKKGVVKNIKIYGEMHRFIPAYAAWLGIRVAEIQVKHHPRRYGQTKYGLERVGRVILDLITLRFFTGFKTRPLQFFGKIALFVTSAGSMLSIILFLLGYLTASGIDFQTFILMVLFSIMGGFQFIIVGLLSEIIMRGFLESQNRDEYVVEMIFNKQIPKKK